METLEFLTHRSAFAGVPYGALQTTVNRVRAGESWAEICLGQARELRHAAERAQRADRLRTAASSWQWAACTFHAAAFGLHLEPERTGWTGRVLRLRKLSRLAYRRALLIDEGLARAVEIPVNGAPVRGYFRRPTLEAAPVVVLLNGLDSTCEVEMHAFSSWMLSYGLATLALDLPACFSSEPRRPCFNVEEVAAPIADWIGSRPGFQGCSMGAFGVSFGGHLVARLMAGDSRFRAGVCVSPPAWLGPRELRLRRVRLMFACAFALNGEEEVDEFASRIRLEHVRPPRGGRLLLFEMEEDQLFGREHVEAFRRWGGDRVELRRLGAEHVGTSKVHQWLPEVCDWLNQNLCEETEVRTC